MNLNNQKNEMSEKNIKDLFNTLADILGEKYNLDVTIDVEKINRR